MQYSVRGKQFSFPAPDNHPLPTIHYLLHLFYQNLHALIEQFEEMVLQMCHGFFDLVRRFEGPREKLGYPHAFDFHF